MCPFSFGSALEASCKIWRLLFSWRPDIWKCSIPEFPIFFSGTTNTIIAKLTTTHHSFPNIIPSETWLLCTSTYKERGGLLLFPTAAIASNSLRAGELSSTWAIWGSQCSDTLLRWLPSLKIWNLRGWFPVSTVIRILSSILFSAGNSFMCLQCTLSYSTFRL